MKNYRKKIGKNVKKISVKAGKKCYTIDIHNKDGELYETECDI